MCANNCAKQYITKQFWKSPMFLSIHSIVYYTKAAIKNKSAHKIMTQYKLIIRNNTLWYLSQNMWMHKLGPEQIFYTVFR